MEQTHLMIKGIWRDVLTAADDTILYDSGWRNNTIMTGCRVMLAAFMSNTPALGIQNLAVGQGSSDWDGDTPPPVDLGANDLVNRFGGSPIPLSELTLEFLDDSDTPTPPGTRTSQLQITATLEPGYPAPLPGQSTYPLREFGLFGEIDGGPTLINTIRHPVIYKDTDTTLLRVMRLYF